MSRAWSCSSIVRATPRCQAVSSSDLKKVRQSRISSAQISAIFLPPICAATGQVCRSATLTDTSAVHLRIENLFSPVSLVDNSIGFETLPAGYTQDGQIFDGEYALKGDIRVELTNVFLEVDEGSWVPLTQSDGDRIGRIETYGHHVDVTYPTRWSEWR